MKTSPGAGSSERTADGNVLGLRDHPARWVEERGRAVATLFDVRREGGADEDGSHLVRDRAKRRADQLELNFHSFVTLS
jgi:hypothetical protein